MGLAIDVVKRGGMRPAEAFDRDKLHASIVAACRSVRSLDGLADDTAHAVCEIVIIWTSDKTEITSADIRRRAAAALATYHPDAAYLYKNHKVII